MISGWREGGGEEEISRHSNKVAVISQLGAQERERQRQRVTGNQTPEKRAEETRN